MAASGRTNCVNHTPAIDAKQTFRVGMSAIPRKAGVVFFCYPLVIICPLIVARSCFHLLALIAGPPHLRK